MNRIYVIGNYFYIQQEGDSTPNGDSRGNTVVNLISISPRIYRIQSPNLGTLEFDITTLVDANDVSYTIESWETFYTENSGFNPVSVAQLTEIQNELEQKVPINIIGQPEGIASLNELSQLPAQQFPNYIHEQNEYSLIWYVNHQLSRKCNVQITDVAGNEIVANINWVDNDNVEIRFNIEEIGFVYCN